MHMCCASCLSPKAHLENPLLRNAWALADLLGFLSYTYIHASIHMAERWKRHCFERRSGYQIGCVSACSTWKFHFSLRERLKPASLVFMAGQRRAPPRTDECQFHKEAATQNRGSGTKTNVPLSAASALATFSL
jgi:hypothetical protein